jgi:hypothetical protein
VESLGPWCDYPDRVHPMSRWLTAVAILTVVTFGAVRHFDFVNYDDREFVVENHPKLRRH